MKPGDIVRVRRMHRDTKGGVVMRVTRTQIVLRDGTRWRRDNGRMHGNGPTADRIEPWGDEHRRAG